MSSSAKYTYYEACVSSCLGRMNDVKKGCSKKIVDCGPFGGYDPDDMCKETCLRQEDHSEYK